jgi:hypothetical protein
MKTPSRSSVSPIGGETNLNHFVQHVDPISSKLLMHMENFIQIREIYFQVRSLSQCSQKDKKFIPEALYHWLGGMKYSNYIIQHVETIALVVNSNRKFCTNRRKSFSSSLSSPMFTKTLKFLPEVLYHRLGGKQTQVISFSMLTRSPRCF